MKKILLFSLLLQQSISFAQNVGIGTSTPTEMLDVNGNINVSGSLKVNGNAGTSNQVLMKDASNNPIWGDISRFKNQVVFDCNSVTNTTGSNNCSANWIVPAGVFQVFVECWGGGGGGGSLTGGGAGGYICGTINVTAGNTAIISIAAGGSYGSTTVGGTTGNNSSVSITTVNITASGGTGGYSGDPLVLSYYAPVPGGSYSSNTQNALGLRGESGNVTHVHFEQAGTSEFIKSYTFGKGGDSPLFPGSGQKGGTRLNNNVGTLNVYTLAEVSGAVPGTGGGADALGGSNGTAGRVIIHY